MFFTVKNSIGFSADQLRTDALLKAYYLIEKYPLNASELLLDQFLKQQYKISLKDLCIDLLLNISFYKNDENNLILLFKNPEHDRLARLVTFGNGAIPGSQILQSALNN